MSSHAVWSDWVLQLNSKCSLNSAMFLYVFLYGYRRAPLEHENPRENPDNFNEWCFFNDYIFIKICTLVYFC